MQARAADSRSRGIAQERRGGRGVPAGQPVFEIMDLSRLRAAFGVPDTKIGQFTIGQAVEVVADAFPSKRFAGHVTKIVPAAI